MRHCYGFSSHRFYGNFFAPDHLLENGSNLTRVDDGQLTRPVKDRGIKKFTAPFRRQFDERRNELF